MKYTRYIWIILILFTNLFPISADDYYFKQISLEEGLPSAVQTSFTDSKGYIWMGTADGLAQYDGYTLKMYTHENDKPFTLPSDDIFHIIQGRQNNHWILTSGGVAYYQPEYDNFITIKDQTGKNIIAHSAYLTENDIIFFAKGAIYKWNYQTKSIILWKELSQDLEFCATSIQRLDKESLLCCQKSTGKLLRININTGKKEVLPFKDDNISAILTDSQNQIWLAIYNKGVKCYSPNGELLAWCNIQNSSLSSNTILCLTECKSEIWIGTDGGGLNILNPKNKTIKTFKSTPGDNSSFPVNSINSLYYDGNILWASTVRGGLVGIKKVFMKTYVSTTFGNDTGLSDNIILSLYEDSSGAIWIGTDGGGINRLDSETHKFKHYASTKGNKVSSIAELDKDHLLFSCFNKGVFTFNKQNGAVQSFIVVNENVNKNLFNRKKAVNLHSNLHNMLILTDSIFIYNLKTHSFRKIQSKTTDAISGVLIPITNEKELTYVHDTKRIYSFNNNTYQLKDLFSFQIQSDTIVKSVSRDDDAAFWIGTNYGLSCFNPLTNEFKTLTTPFFNKVTAVVCDHQENVWIGYRGKQLYSWSIKNKKFNIYSESDGLQLNEYMNKPRLMSSTGNIYMGGIKGLLQISKQLKADEPDNCDFELTGINLNGIAISPNTQIIKMPWNGVLTLKIFPQEKDLFRDRIYHYRIKGKDDQIINSYQPEVCIRSLPSGDYSVFVSCNTKNGNWTPEKEIIKVIVTPPWYMSRWFILCCVITGIILIATYIFITLRRKQNKLKWEMKEHEQKTYEDKVRFLINISHELRTPLTLIYAPLKSILQALPDSDRNYSPLKSIYKQTQRMRSLINMVLDVRRLEVTENKLILQLHPLNKWIEFVVKDFEAEAINRNIQITFKLDERIQEICFDDNKCEIVLTNLLINAFKYSADHTEIQITSELDINEQKVRISVSDQGKGLKNIDIDKLFTRFYQGDNGQNGSGIGLSYSKILIELHKGNIGATEDEKGSTFYFDLPLKYIEEKTTNAPKSYFDKLILSDFKEIEQTTSIEPYFTENSNLLLVDDNDGLIAFLKEGLQNKFKHIYTASNGIEALEIIKSKQPDIVVSDLMMPEMDGYVLCKNIKENLEISHIPVILLTAKNDEQSEIFSYKNGANAYLPKPFDLDMLLEKIQSILRNKENIKNYYFKRGIPLPEITTSSNADENFLLNFNKIVFENIENPKLDVLFLCNEIGMSRSSLYNKVKILTNMGVNDYINKLKMEKAILFIKTTDLTITEISDKVGFSSLKYFSTSFKQYTGKSPSTFKKESFSTKESNI